MQGVTSGGQGPHFMTHGIPGQTAARGAHMSKGRNTIMHPQAGMDPFGRVNQKARKVIESVERQRQTPADPRAGSTGGSFDEDLEFANKLPHKANIIHNYPGHGGFNQQQVFNATTQNFYSISGENSFDMAE